MYDAEPRFVVDQTVELRVFGEQEWRRGRTKNLSRSGLFFSSEADLEVGAVIEIRLLNIDADGKVSAVGPTCGGRVVRRVLMGWPDIYPLIAIQFIKESLVETGPNSDGDTQTASAPIASKHVEKANR